MKQPKPTTLRERLLRIVADLRERPGRWSIDDAIRAITMALKEFEEDK